MSLARLLFMTALVQAMVALMFPDFRLLILPALAFAAVSFLAWGWPIFRRRPDPRWIVVDGSNVMHWLDGTARIEPVMEVLRELTTRGFSPGVVFDANAGYKLEGRYLGEHRLARWLHLPQDRVLVVPKGTPADAFILRSARGLGAQIVTNDRYRDWSADYPEVEGSDLLIRGRYREGRLELAEIPARRIDPCRKA